MGRPFDWSTVGSRYLEVLLIYAKTMESQLTTIKITRDEMGMEYNIHEPKEYSILK